MNEVKSVTKKIIITRKSRNVDRFLKPKDVAKTLGCGMTRAYAIINQKDFPKIMISKRAYIPADAFNQWAKNYTYKEYVL